MIRAHRPIPTQPASATAAESPIAASTVQGGLVRRAGRFGPEDDCPMAARARFVGRSTVPAGGTSGDLTSRMRRNAALPLSSNWQITSTLSPRIAYLEVQGALPPVARTVVHTRRQSDCLFRHREARSWPGPRGSLLISPLRQYKPGARLMA